MEPDNASGRPAGSSIDRAAKLRLEFAPDSPLEGAGFEPSVPRRHPASPPCRLSFAPYFRWRRIEQRRHEAGLKAWSHHVEPMARIRLPPAKSQERTRLRGSATVTRDVVSSRRSFLRMAAAGVRLGGPSGEVKGCRRGGYRKAPRNLASRQSIGPAADQEAQDFKPAGLAERTENLCGIRRFHDSRIIV